MSSLRVFYTGAADAYLLVDDGWNDDVRYAVIEVCSGSQFRAAEAADQVAPWRATRLRTPALERLLADAELVAD